MSKEQLKEALLLQIEEADERLLKMIYALVDAYTSSEEESVVGYDVNGKAKTVNEMKISLKEELEKAKAGKYITLSELKNKSEKWLKGSK